MPPLWNILLFFFRLSGCFLEILDICVWPMWQWLQIRLWAGGGITLSLPVSCHYIKLKCWYTYMWQNAGILSTTPWCKGKSKWVHTVFGLSKTYLITLHMEVFKIKHKCIPRYKDHYSTPVNIWDSVLLPSFPRGVCSCWQIWAIIKFKEYATSSGHESNCIWRVKMASMICDGGVLKKRFLCVLTMTK